MKVAFLDRDGVINKDKGYTHKINDFEFTDGCIEALQLLQAKGFEIIVVTNQSGIGRGYYTEDDYQLLTRWYINQLAEKNIFIKNVFHCPHTPESGCDCRKPKSGLFQQACDKYSIDLKSSLMMGDKLSDIEAAKNIGVACCYLISDVEIATPEYRVAADLLTGAHHLIKNS